MKIFHNSICGDRLLCKLLRSCENIGEEVIKCHVVLPYLRIPQSSFKHPEELRSHPNTTRSSVPLPEVNVPAFLS
jgi:hypothetical protein